MVQQSVMYSFLEIQRLKLRLSNIIRLLPNMLGTGVQVVVMLHHTDRDSGTSHFMRPHVGPPAVLQNRK